MVLLNRYISSSMAPINSKWIDHKWQVHVEDAQAPLVEPCALCLTLQMKVWPQVFLLPILSHPASHLFIHPIPAPPSFVSLWHE